MYLMMRNSTLLLFLFLASTLSMFAQEVTGVVKDETGETLIGATVSLLNTNVGTITDFDGNFTIAAQNGTTLRVSYTGYDSEDVIVDGTNPLEIILSEGVNLDEVTVVGSRGKPRTSYDAPVPVDNIDARTL